MVGPDSEGHTGPLSLLPPSSQGGKDHVYSLDGEIGEGGWQVQLASVRPWDQLGSASKPSSILCVIPLSPFSKVLFIIQLNISLQRMFFQFDQSCLSFPKGLLVWPCRDTGS